MDKLFNKNWFIKISSLVIAIMLFFMVNMDGTPNQPAGLPGSTDSTRVLEDVQLNVHYDDENYVLTEAPETVQVTLRGPQNVLTMEQVRTQQHELYVDLTDQGAGTHYEQVQYSGFSSDVSVAINPAYVEVTLQERQTVSFPVEVDLNNEEEIEGGRSVGTPSVEPSTVDVTAAQGMIEQIAFARATIDVSGRDSTFEETASVVLYDENGNALDLNADPPAVEVTVPITSPNKEVPIRISRTGELPEGMAINSISTDPEMVRIFGPEEIIESISFLDGVELDLNDIDGDGSYEVDVPIPDGVESVDPETITVTVDVIEEEEAEFSDFEIGVIGLEEGQSVEFIDPEDGLFDLTVSGSPGALSRLDREDIQVVIDVAGLSEGEHEVDLNFDGPQNLRFNQAGSTASFILSEDSTAMSTSPNQQEEENENNETNENNESNENNENSENNEEENNNNNNDADGNEEIENNVEVNNNGNTS